MPDPNNTNTPGDPPPAPRPPAQSPKPSPPKPPAKRSFQAPKGTRDLYPEDANLRRFITEAWRNASIRHGFEEIDGPTFEDADLYKVKSGDGILAEMFGVFSGKSPEDVAQVRDTGEAPLVLRPEFTPTLARMVAARAAQLSKPTKWFTAGPFFRAERPQRGRLREFLQWNVDFIGLPGLGESTPTADQIAEAKAAADAECIACCIDVLASLGLTSRDVRIKFFDRNIHADWGRSVGIPEDRLSEWFIFLDGAYKRSDEQNATFLRENGIPANAVELLHARAKRARESVPSSQGALYPGILGETDRSLQAHLLTWRCLLGLGVSEWCEPLSTTIVRGLAYYTGMVFEVIADGERAVAGGGRYDNLIELFGGPPTPAVGFGMGDVVLTNLLRDKGLLPQGATLLDRLSQTPASLRPDAFIFTPDESLDPLVRTLVADLRRGSTSDQPRPPLHARHSYKSTRNVGKLLKEATSQHARIAVIIESAAAATLKPLDGGEQISNIPLSEIPSRLAALLA